jgi:hypothetical protein
MLWYYSKRSDAIQDGAIVSSGIVGLAAGGLEGNSAPFEGSRQYLRISHLDSLE